MKAKIEHYPTDTAKAGTHSALWIDSAAIGHPSCGQTYPMLCMHGCWAHDCCWPFFKRIRRRFAVYP